MYSRFYESPYSSMRVSLKAQPVYPEDIQCIHDPGPSNTGGIYLSNLQAAQNPRTLNKYSIKAVLTAASGAYLSHNRSQVPHYKFIPAEDHESYDMSRHFQEGVRFIEEHVKQTNVLIHCMAGVSRSVTLLLAYLIKCRGMGYQEAFQMVKRRRRIIHPNQGFIRQLKKFEREIKNNNVSQNPQKKEESPARRYQTPQQKRYESMAATSMTSSFINTAKPTQLSDTKRSVTISKTHNYDNEQELDQKIAQIRKKYSRLSGNTPYRRPASSKQIPSTTTTPPTNRYTPASYTRQPPRRDYLSSSTYLTHRKPYSYKMDDMYDSIRESNLRTTTIGLPLTKTTSYPQDRSFKAY